MKYFMVLTFALLCPLGCGHRYPETAQVSGKITYSGQPVPTGRICFWPKEGRPAMAEIRDDGTYSLTSFAKGDGAILGEHRVSIKASRVHVVPGNSATGAATDESTVKTVVEWLVPQRFERPETSDLKATVQAGENSIDFDLPAER